MGTGGVCLCNFASFQGTHMTPTAGGQNLATNATSQAGARVMPEGIRSDPPAFDLSVFTYHHVSVIT